MRLERVIFEWRKHETTLYKLYLCEHKCGDGGGLKIVCGAVSNATVDFIHSKVTLSKYFAYANGRQRPGRVVASAPAFEETSGKF